MTDNNDLPLDVSKGVEFDFTVQGLTAEQIKSLYGLILDEVENYNGTLTGSYISIAHLEDMVKEQGTDWEQFEPDLLDLLDMVEDDISLDELEEWEDDFDPDGMPYDLSDYEY